ncbi:MAG: hypothetical protein PHH26_06795 [Candidatus Thermoplasmatota archaeon]|nr:hypothetical protein [Candidatus Thermoplasmatota archaeon]
MPVKNVELQSIEARRFSRLDEKPQQLRIDHNSTIRSITEVNDKEANIEFTYTSTFGALGMIRMEGKITYDGDAPAISREWAITHKMPDAIASEIHTAVMHICVPEAVFLSRELRLPPPIPLPQVSFQKPQDQQKPKSSPEVA